jgi:transposase-like protein
MAITHATRKLSERYVYAFADGTYFTVIYNNEGCKMPILAVVGIAETGEREVLADRASAIAKMNKPGKTRHGRPQRARGQSH